MFYEVGLLPLMWDDVLFERKSRTYFEERVGNERNIYLFKTDHTSSLKLKT
jgi:hypothetical protein